MSASTENHRRGTAAEWTLLSSNKWCSRLVSHQLTMDIIGFQWSASPSRRMLLQAVQCIQHLNLWALACGVSCCCRCCCCCWDWRWQIEAQRIRGWETADGTVKWDEEIRVLNALMVRADDEYENSLPDICINNYIIWTHIMVIEPIFRPIWLGLGRGGDLGGTGGLSPKIWGGRRPMHLSPSIFWEV